MHASSAAPTGPITHASTFDKTFLCRVRRAPFVNLSASSKIPSTKPKAAGWGFDNERCGAAARVLVRLQFRTTNGVPSHALFAVRNDNAKRRPIAFYNWSADKVSIDTANNCTVS